MNSLEGDNFSSSRFERTVPPRSSTTTSPAAIRQRDSTSLEWVATALLGTEEEEEGVHHTPTATMKLPPEVEATAAKVKRAGYKSPSIWERVRANILEPVATLPNLLSSVPYVGVSLGTLTTPIFTGVSLVLQKIVQITHTKATTQLRQDNREMWKERTLEKGLRFDHVKRKGGGDDLVDKADEAVQKQRHGDLLNVFGLTEKDFFEEFGTDKERDKMVSLETLERQITVYQEKMERKSEEGLPLFSSPEGIEAVQELERGYRARIARMMALLNAVKADYRGATEVRVGTLFTKPLGDEMKAAGTTLPSIDTRRRELRRGQILSKGEVIKVFNFAKEVKIDDTFTLRELQERFNGNIPLSHSPFEQKLAREFLATLQTRTNEIGVKERVSLDEKLTYGTLVERYLDQTLAMSQSARAALLTLQETKTKSMGNVIEMQLAGKKLSFHLSLTAAAMWLVLNAGTMTVGPAVADAFTGVGYGLAAAGLALSVIGILTLACMRPNTFAAYAQGTYIVRELSGLMLKILSPVVEKIHSKMQSLEREIQEVQESGGEVTPFQKKQQTLLKGMYGKVTKAFRRLKILNSMAVEKITTAGIKDHLRESRLDRARVIKDKKGGLPIPHYASSVEEFKDPETGVVTYERGKREVEKSGYDEGILSDISEIAARGWDLELEELLKRYGVEPPKASAEEVDTDARAGAVLEGIRRFIGADSTVMDEISNELLEERRRDHRETLINVLFGENGSVREKAIAALEGRGVIVDEGEVERVKGQPKRRKVFIEKIRYQIKEQQPELVDRNATFGELKALLSLNSVS